MKEHQIRFTLSEDDFESSMGRTPSSQDEFDEWARGLERELGGRLIDWDIVYECARDAMGEAR